MHSISTITKSQSGLFNCSDRLKIYSNILLEDLIDKNKYKGKLVIEYLKFIVEHGPYYFFITLTFRQHVKFDERCQYTNYLLHVYNQKHFRRNYLKKNKGVTGFAFFEEGRGIDSEGVYHIHILIKSEGRYFEKCIDEHKNIFKDSASKVLDGWGKRVFNNKCIDFGAVADDGAIGYCIKSIRDKKITCIKLIGPNGLSDNLQASQ